MRRGNEYLPAKGLTTVGDLQASIKYAQKWLPVGSDRVDEQVRVRWVANFPLLQWGHNFVSQHQREFDELDSTPLHGEPHILQVTMFKNLRRGEIGRETIDIATKAFNFSGVVGSVSEE